MPNSNYERGVRWERQVMADYADRGYSCSRTAGSHSNWDVIAIHPDRPVVLIQCKCLKTGTKQQAEAMVKKFMKAPPLRPSSYFHQCLSVYAMAERAECAGII